MGHLRGAPFHPQTHGKIERWHQTLKNRIPLENYYLPSDLEATSGAARPSCWNEKGLNDKPSRTAARLTAARPPNIDQQVRQILPAILPLSVSNNLTTDITPPSFRRSASHC
jgi:hypothetical protein